jgi:hypothetical protein
MFHANSVFFFLFVRLNSLVVLCLVKDSTCFMRATILVCCLILVCAVVVVQAQVRNCPLIIWQSGGSFG